jgi:hypothetical protein
MFLIDLFFVFVIALVLSLFLAVFMGWRPPGRMETTAWVSTLFLFIILFLAVWAGGVWIIPFGPPLWGGYWLPFFVVGLVISFLLLAAASAPAPRKPRTRMEAVQQAEDRENAERVFNVFFGILAVGLIASIVVAYAA